MNTTIDKKLTFIIKIMILMFLKRRGYNPCFQKQIIDILSYYIEIPSYVIESTKIFLSKCTVDDFTNMFNIEHKLLFSTNIISKIFAEYQIPTNIIVRSIDSGYYTWHLAKNDMFNKNILLAVLNKWEFEFRNIPLQYISEDLCIIAINKNVSLIEYVPEKFYTPTFIDNLINIMDNKHKYLPTNIHEHIKYCNDIITTKMLKIYPDGCFF